MRAVSNISSASLDALAPPTPLAAVNDPDAFWTLLGPHIGWIHRQLRRLGVRENDLDDVCQDVLIALHKRRDQFDFSREIRPWAFGFAAWVASDYRKRRQVRERHAPLDHDHEPADPAPGADARLDAEAERQLLLEALDQLDDKKRTLLVLVDLEETAMPRAAEILGIPVNTGYSRLRTARTELASAVRRIRGIRGTR